MKMLSFTYKYSCTFFFISIYAFSFINSLPVTPKVVEGNPFDEFIKFLSKNDCKMPSGIALPFQNSSQPSNFNYLSTPLQECRTTDALQKNDEAFLLCKEIFDVLQNITCYDYKLPIQIESTSRLSENVCKDFNEIQFVLPKRKDYLSTRLKDELVCGLMCTKEKYELLCKTLLWSYDALEKVKLGLHKSAVDQKLQGDSEENKISDDDVSQGKDAAVDKVYSNKDRSVTGTEKPKTSVHDEESNGPVASSDGIHSAVPNSINKITNSAKVSKAPDQIRQSDSATSLTTRNSTATLSENETGSKTASSLKNSVSTKGTENKGDSENLNVNKEDLFKKEEETVKPGVRPNFNTEVPQDNQENDVNVDEQPKKDGGANVPQTDADANNLPTNNEEVKSPQPATNTATDVLKDAKKSGVTVTNNGTSKEATTKSDDTTIDPNLKNELSNVDLEGDGNKNTGPKTQEDNKKEAEKPKLIDTSETTTGRSSPLFEPTEPQLLPDDEEQRPEEKEPDQYNDEKEDDYPKPDYDNNLNPPTKSRDSIGKGSIGAPSQISNDYSVFNPRTFGRVREEIPMIPSLPEQEDSHFFFYFLLIVFVLMGGYFVFHNKQKIIALIVEGRHERRRRSHGVGYKKLETK